MGLLDIAQGLLANSDSSGNVIGTVMEVLNSRSGGLDGIVQSLQQGGLTETVSSWIGSGQNAPVSGDQLQSALGSGVVQDLASKLGVSPDVAGSHLAELLPGIIDRLTPNGEVPSGGLASAGMELLSGFLRGRT